MATELKVKDLVKGKRYNVFFVDSAIKRSMGATPNIVQSTGTFRKIVDGEAVIEKDEKGRAVIGYFGDSYRFEEVPSATANKVVDPVPEPAFKRYPAGPGLNAARALLALGKTQGARRKTRKHTRRSRKTRHSTKKGKHRRV
jgi:hypothetical protein